MTRVVGVNIVAAPCCGARYQTSRYASMNFHAFEYWTDGWQDSLYKPNDPGLRRCRCGRFLLMGELMHLETAETSDLPHIDRVPDALLPECIATADDVALEFAARLDHWHALNHPYRKRYRTHRAAEEANTRVAWEAAHPDRRTWWDRLLRRKAPVYTRPPGSPFTFPAFQPNEEQLRNMARLSEILVAWRDAAERGYTLELAELYREQGRFVEARQAMSRIDPREAGVTSRLIGQLIEEREVAPMRYQM
ncbi:MAG: hypothetical protein RIS35_3146 [Pseudomonadota bacterium]|jgi:hypothetical protein